MSHQKDFKLLFENVSNFSFLNSKSPTILQKNKGQRYNLEYNRINSFSLSPDPDNFIISKEFSINFEGIGEYIENSAKNEHFSDFQDFSNHKDSKNKRKNINEKRKSKLNKSHQKELTKNNKDFPKKAEKKITLIKPNMFEDNSLSSKSSKNIIQKTETDLKSFKPFPNLMNKINFPFTNFINNNLSKNINIINSNNLLKIPTIPLNTNKITNNFINNSTINPDYKQKLFPPKPLTTFNILKLEKNENENLTNLPGQQIENKNSNEQKNFCVKYINTRKGRKSKKSKKVYYESKHTKFSEDNITATPSRRSRGPTTWHNWPSVLLCSEEECQLKKSTNKCSTSNPKIIPISSNGFQIT